MTVCSSNIFNLVNSCVWQTDCVQTLKLSVVSTSPAHNEGWPGYETVIEEPAYLCCHALMHSCVRMHLGHKPRERPRRVQYFSWKQES